MLEIGVGIADEKIACISSDNRKVQSQSPSHISMGIPSELTGSNFRVSPVDMPEDDKEHRGDSLTDLINDMASNTGMQGLPNFHRARSIARRLFWLVVFVGGVGMLIFMVAAAVVKYYTYPTKTIINKINSKRESFPAVTFCNVNPLRKNAISSIGGAISEMFEPKDDDSTGDAAAPGQGWEDLETGGESFYENDDPSFLKNQGFSEMVAQLNDTTRATSGHSLGVMLIACSFDGRPCSPVNFTSFLNSKYGNCFAFHMKTINTPTYPFLISTHVGPDYGLSLTVYVQQKQYLPDLTDAIGLRVQVHHASRMPFPEDHGFNVSPGFKTSVGLDKQTTTRVGSPYGRCVNIDRKGNEARNAYLSVLPGISYTADACERTCYQRNLVKTCLCYDSKFPWQQSGMAFSTLTLNVSVSPCMATKTYLANGTWLDDAQSLREDACKDTVYTAFYSGALGCSQECGPECTIYQYGLSISQTRWPPDVGLPSLADELIKRDPESFRDVGEMDAENQRKYFDSNLVKLEVYYKDLGHQETVTSPSYQVFELLSELGGQAGLWLGASVVALFELAELIIDIVVIVLKKKIGSSGDRKRLPNVEMSSMH